MNYKTKLERNISRNYIFKFLNNLDFTRGIWMLYLAYKGLTLFEIGLMETVYHISSFSMEIPTGAIADIFGRKISRTLGKAANIVSALFMIFGSNTLMFAIAFFFTALGNNLESGAGDALVYDSLKEIGRENSYLKVVGISEFIFNIASIISLIAAGYIATLSFETVYKFALVLAIITMVQTLSFTEPESGRAESAGNFAKTFAAQLKESFAIVKNDKRVLRTIIASELFATLYTTEFFYLQNRLQGLGSSTFEIGIVLASGSLICAIMATQTHKLEKKISIAGIARIAAAIGIVGFWGMSIAGIERYAFVILSAIEGILFVSVSDYINKLIPSKQRATILSLQSMMFSVYMIIIFPVAGKIGDVYGLGLAFTVIAAAATLCLGAVLILMRKIKA
ncbi:MAG: MFS transporter [Clostridia bacterium]|nr:MFS transporter [Clostridia bacterium]